MTTVPISDIVPLAQWIQAYHAFRTRLDLLLYQTGWDLDTLHTNKFGTEASPGVWETLDYKVLVHGRALTFEVQEASSVEDALLMFGRYQKRLFGD